MVVEEFVDSREDKKKVRGRSSKKYRRIEIYDDSKSEEEESEYRSI